MESEKEYEEHLIEVDAGQGSIRIDKFLSDKLMMVSRTRIQQGCEDGNILVNGKNVKSNYKVRPLDSIRVRNYKKSTSTDIIPQDLPLEIVYEDEEVMLVNKKAGMVVHPAHGNPDGTLVNAVAFHWLDDKSKVEPLPRIGLVHRIDKDTSGLLVFGKSDDSIAFLSGQFMEKTAKRKYRALVWGDFEEDEGTVTGHIGRHQRHRQKFDVYPDGDYGKEAITHYKVIERFGYTTLIECVLETGRTHQIRVHMKSIGHPLFNDSTYGGDKIVKGTVYTKYKQFVMNAFKLCPRQALHAQTLGFVHPVTMKEVHFESELPEDMEAVIEKWRNYIVR